MYNPWAVLRLLPIIKGLASFIGNMDNVEVATPKYERQQSVNNFGCCILYNPKAIPQLLPIIEVLAAFIGKIVIVDVTSPENERQKSVNRVSTERQQIVNRASTERQQSVNNLGCCILYNPRAMLQH